MASAVWETNGFYLSFGASSNDASLRFLPSGPEGTPVGLTSSTPLTQLQLMNGSMYAIVRQSGLFGVSKLFTAPYPTLSGAASVSAGSLPGMPINAYFSAFHLESETSMYMAAGGSGSCTSNPCGLYRYALADGRWSLDPAYPRFLVNIPIPGKATLTFLNLNGVTGAMDPATGSYTLFVVTRPSLVGDNFVLKVRQQK